MTKTDAAGKMKQDVLAAWREGYSYSEIQALLGMEDRSRLWYYSNELVKDGALVRVGKGQYIPADMEHVRQRVEPPAPATTPKQVAHQNGHLPPENTSRRVQLPEYMRGRKPITLVIERNTDEIEDVMRLELCIGGQWIAIPVSSDLRMYIGDRRVLYSATQETYEGVSAYRVTLLDGQQADYAHNPAHPLTIDRRVTA